ncbi:hypothetical protein ACTD5D_11215 [Nocardia takedensis]|uniref:hypothetical protein n=1 Tax=Nocardia takedensis TaxID=259390 RepID=UPI0002F24C00|nr:hypothetical protein [Nocardia takedensis]
MYSNRNTRRLLGAAAVAGALATLPVLTAGSAAATPQTGAPQVTEVGRGHDCRRDKPWEDFFDNDRYGRGGHHHGHCGDRKPWDLDNPWDAPWRGFRVEGSFGSS